MYPRLLCDPVRESKLFSLIGCFPHFPKNNLQAVRAICSQSGTELEDVYASHFWPFASITVNLYSGDAVWCQPGPYRSAVFLGHSVRSLRQRENGRRGRLAYAPRQEQSWIDPIPLRADPK